MTAPARVAVVMGSDSDWSVAGQAVDVLVDMGIACEARVISAHRTPEELLDYAGHASERGLGVLIGAAGGAAHLPGMLAAVTTLPVIGLPVPLDHLDGLDSLLSIVQMPSGIPVATVAIGAGRNAGLLAARILAVGDPGLRAVIADQQRAMAETTRSKDQRIGLLFADRAAERGGTGR
jgi:5-(carboxyamino)imidazole ribonucleotide mutase